MFVTQENEQWSIVSIAREAGIQLFEKKGRPDQYAANCPFCGDNRKRLNLHGTRDVFCCYNCDAKGGALKFYALVHNMSEASAKEQLQGEKSKDHFPRKSNPRHPAEQLTVTDIRNLGFVGKPINWFELRKQDQRKARQLADWMWREKRQREQKIERLMHLLSE